MGLKIGMQTYGWLAYANKFRSNFGLEMVLHEVKKAGYDYVDLSGYALEQLGRLIDAQKLFN